MNCEHPIYVRNKTKRYCNGLTKVGFWVPCGKCAACRAAMRDEWFLRSYAEYLECKEKGGSVYFVTLTYDPKSRPMFNPNTGRLCHGLQLEEKGCFPVFDKKDINRYRKSLSKWFERKGVTGIRYLFCSEYGTSDEGKHLPHYHGLIFVPKNDIKTKDIDDVILDMWKFGLSFYSNKGATIDSLKAILYVTKYCCKQIEFYDRKDVDEYMMRGKIYQERLKPYLPNHWQSKGYGLYLAKWLKDKDNIEEYFHRGVSKDFIGLQQENDKFYNLPRYIVNKLMYDVKDGVRVPNEFYYEISSKLYDKKIEKSEKSLSRFFSVNGLRTLIDSDDCHNLIAAHWKKWNYSNNYAGLVNYLTDQMNGRTLRELALYSKVFRNLTISDADMSFFDCIPNYDVEELQMLGYAFVTEVANDDYFEYSEKSALELGKFDNPNLWNYSPRFENFEEILDTIQAISSLASKRRMRKKVEDEKVISKLKNLVK